MFGSNKWDDLLGGSSTYNFPSGDVSTFGGSSSGSSYFDNSHFNSGGGSSDSNYFDSGSSTVSSNKWDDLLGVVVHTI